MDKDFLLREVNPLINSYEYYSIRILNSDELDKKQILIKIFFGNTSKQIQRPL